MLRPTASFAATRAAASRAGVTPSWWAIAANAGLAGSIPLLPFSASIWFIARWAALWLTPSWVARAATIDGAVPLSCALDARAAFFMAIAELFGSGDVPAAGDLLGCAELLAVADGPGLPDDVEPDAKAAAGTAISTAAMAPAAT